MLHAIVLPCGQQILYMLTYVSFLCQLVVHKSIAGRDKLRLVSGANNDSLVGNPNILWIETV